MKILLKEPSFGIQAESAKPPSWWIKGLQSTMSCKVYFKSLLYAV